MLSKIHKRGVELSKSLESRLKAEIAEVRKYSWKDLRRGVTVNFAMTLFILVMFSYFIWSFDYIHRLYDSIVLNLLAACFALAVFYDGIRKETDDRRFSWGYAAMAASVVAILLLAFSDRYGNDALGVNVLGITLSSPLLIAFWILVRKRNVLAVGMVPAAFILMGYWVAPGISEGFELKLFLVPLMAVSVLLVAWTLLVWLLFESVVNLTRHPTCSTYSKHAAHQKHPMHSTYSKHDAHQKHPVLGPFMESLAMLFLFIPLIVLAILVTRTIPGGEDWTLVITAIVGVVLGSVVSDPFMCFLRNFGNLPSACKNYGRDKAEGGQDDERQVSG